MRDNSRGPGNVDEQLLGGEKIPSIRVDPFESTMLTSTRHTGSRFASYKRVLLGKGISSFRGVENFVDSTRFDRIKLRSGVPVLVNSGQKLQFYMM